MSNDFKEKMQLYKDGKLDESESALIEEEIEKYAAIKDYLDDDKELIGELKGEMDRIVLADVSIGKKINRKMVKKIIGLSLATIIACLIFIPVLSLSAASILGRAFRVESTRFVQERNFAGQFLRMVFPQANVSVAGDHTQFYNQQFTIGYTKGIGRRAPKAEIEVSYSFGKLKKPERAVDERLAYLSRDRFYAVNQQAYFTDTEWDYLEKAPEGTIARILVTFKSKFSPEQAAAALGERYLAPGKDFDIDMLADIDSEIVLANTDPVYFYERNKGMFSKQDELNFISKFNAYDNDAHKQVLLFGLNQIKNYKSIADYITVNYSTDWETLFENIDGSVSYVEKNGVQYVGALITGDTKELLKLKGNPGIFACSVEDIVVW